MTVSPGGDVNAVAEVGTGHLPFNADSENMPSTPVSPPVTGGEPIPAPLAGNIFKVLVKPGQQVAEGENIIILEAMKMETAVSAPRAGTISEVLVNEGDSIAVGAPLVTIA